MQQQKKSSPKKTYTQTKKEQNKIRSMILIDMQKIIKCKTYKKSQFIYKDYQNTSETPSSPAKAAFGRIYYNQKNATNFLYCSICFKFGIITIAHCHSYTYRKHHYRIQHDSIQANDNDNILRETRNYDGDDDDDEFLDPPDK